MRASLSTEIKADTDTLEEEVSATLLRDLKNIWTKLKHVIVPRYKIETDPQAIKELRNWDLWGPLILCLVLSFVLNIGIKTSSKSFSVLFLIMWGGAFVVTINTKLLGGHISFCQCLCVLGYCLFPIVLVAVIIFLLKLVYFHLFIIKLLLAAVALVWSSICSISFMNVVIDEDRKLISLYPIIMFYLFIDWFVLFI